jgi:O-antigen ligase
VKEDESLRSPHNVHFTHLARGGVPGLALWVMTVGAWYTALLWEVRRAWSLRRSHESPLRLRFPLLVVFICSMTAFLINASFDVFLEGPMGGLWFWTVYGVGLAIARRRPQ